ncbi:peptidoglycan-associated lipoprotein Pal [Parvibium lacunae]|uniref:Peptidoglycan-associated protein n=1 Tax=Parvibium lacunae TaxID=1888893 RepID=A0A368L3F5_9BURK|nr:peptidoglycan-associated lipoprotein Pal [Parvibium lacunae]RCS58109.1 peptidoglycan-associated lipoprotein Pal [Parvibium lacunae]
MSTQFLRLGALVFAVSLLNACSSVKLDDKKAEVKDANVSTVNSSGANSGSSTGNANNNVVTVRANQDGGAKQPEGLLAKRSVYFEYDSYVIKDEFQAVIQAHAKNLTANKNAKVIIEGNADERGSREYNLALGQKRAEAVRKALAVLGVGDSQLEAISNGEEKPKATGSDEAAWAENRRADIVYK